jgi:hypothetical protein
MIDFQSPCVSACVVECGGCDAAFVDLCALGASVAKIRVYPPVRRSLGEGGCPSAIKIPFLPNEPIFHSSLVKVIQGYSTPFNPIQGVLRKIFLSQWPWLGGFKSASRHAWPAVANPYRPKSRPIQAYPRYFQKKKIVYFFTESTRIIPSYESIRIDHSTVPSFGRPDVPRRPALQCPHR